MTTVEPEIAIGRRAFPKAQELLAGAPIRTLPDLVEVSWHDTAVAERGSFAVVSRGGPLDDLVGEIVEIRVGLRSVFVYVLGTSTLVTTDLSVYRRVFMGLGLLARDSITAEVRVIA